MAAAGLVAAGGVMVGGCASKPRPAATGALGARARSVEVPGLAELARAAHDQARRPVAGARALPPPPGLTEGVLDSLAPVRGERAMAPLERVLAELASREVAAAPAPGEPAAALDDEAQQRALRRYIAGRQKLLTGDGPGAVVDFRAALAVDPSSGEAWRELAEAQLAAGSRADAAESLRRAEAAGLREARGAALLGRFAAERGEHEEAARLYARALSGGAGVADPLLVPVIEHELARSLVTLGYHAGARDALVRVLSRTAPITASTRYAMEYGAIFRRQGDLWREVGDLEMRLGDEGAALAAYERAARLPTLDGEGVMPRLVYAAMRAGRPAAAGAALLVRIAEADGRVGTEEMDLLRHVSRVGSSRRQLAGSLGQLRAAFGGRTPTLAAGLSRAQAAVAPPDESRRLLSEHLTIHPRDVEAAAALASLVESAPDSARAAAAVAAVRPGAALGLAEGLLRSRHDAAEVLGVLEALGPAIGPSMVRAWMELRRGYQPRAAAALEGLPLSGPHSAALALARAEIGLNAGRPELAEGALRELREDDPGAPRARAFLLAMLQRDAEALAALAPHLEGTPGDPEERIEALLFAAQLAAGLKRPEDAERWLKGAAALDPGDDRALGLLTELYGPGGALADQGKMNRVLRELRQEHADGRFLRLARAREFARRALWEQAEREALPLAEESPGDKGPIEVLAAAWASQPAAGEQGGVRRGLAWLEAQMARRPAEPVLLAARVTLMAAADRGEEAEVLLRGALADGAGPDASRLLERVLRDVLSRPAQANGLALKRLEGRVLSVSESLELAETYTRLERPADAARALRDAVRPEITLRPDQQTRLLVVGGVVGHHALTGRRAGTPDPGAEGAALAILDLSVARGATLPAALHELRLLLKAARPGATADELLEACALAAQHEPRLETMPVIRVADALSDTGRGATALEVIRKAVPRFPAGALRLHLGWFAMAARAGDGPEARAMILSAERAGRLREVVEIASNVRSIDELLQVAHRFEDLDDLVARVRRERPADIPELRSEAAYILGNHLAGLRRTEAANAAYELALEFHADHGWAANNLGYALADAGGDLARAEALLEKAVSLLPREAPVLDSLGWLRYKQGVLEDERDADTGRVTRRGAIPLLRAASTGGRQADPTILDHLGDALWLAGRADEAQLSWGQAQSVASMLLRQSALQQAAADADAPAPAQPGTEPDSPPPDTAINDEHRAIIDACIRKRRDASEGRPVRVAPQATNTDPQPAPRAETAAGGVAPDAPGAPDAPPPPP
ncbi:MAG: hypothetical protein WD749_10255 [Phycisphaerales bacterium]